MATTWASKEDIPTLRVGRPRSIGQNYVKCRRSEYTNITLAILVDEVLKQEKLLGVQSKTGKDMRISLKKIVQYTKAAHSSSSLSKMVRPTLYIRTAFVSHQNELRNNKTSPWALDTIINWENTTNNAYDGRSYTSSILMRRASGRSQRTFEKRGVLSVRVL